MKKRSSAKACVNFGIIVCALAWTTEYECLSSSENNWECSTCKTDLPAFNSVDAIDVFHFDFQKNLPTPKLTVGQFYCRLLWTYLFGIYSASTIWYLFSIYQDDDGVYVA